MIDWNVEEKSKQFEESLRDILDDMHYESINENCGNEKLFRELAISRICLLHETHMKCLMNAISDCLPDA